MPNSLLIDIFDCISSLKISDTTMISNLSAFKLELELDTLRNFIRLLKAKLHTNPNLVSVD